MGFADTQQQHSNHHHHYIKKEMGCPCFEPMSPGGGGVTAPSPPTISLESEVETEEEGEEIMQQQQHNIGNNPTVTSKQVAGIDEKTQKVIERLQKCHPNATDAECIRFYRCTKLNEDAASTRLREWFDWRLEHGLMVSIEDNDAGAMETTTSTSYDDNFKKEDEQLWDEAAKEALRYGFEELGADEITAEIPEKYGEVYGFALKFMKDHGFVAGNHILKLRVDEWDL